MDGHTFQPVRVADDAVKATCSCGWVSAYVHAFEKYAEADHAFHVNITLDIGEKG